MIDLRLGDCLDIMRGMEADSVDAIITDLPYGTTACKWDVVIPFEPMWTQVKRVLKSRGAFVTTASQPFTSLLVCSNLTWFKYCLIWDKIIPSGMSFARYQPMRQHEDIAVFCDGRTVYNAQKSTRPTPIHSGGNCFSQVAPIANRKSGKRFDKVYNDKQPTTILAFDKIRRDSQHPTQKPIALYEYLIRTYTNEGDTVLDFCMGSGTTGVACVQLDRNFIGCEIDQQYFEIAKCRIEAAQPSAIALPLMVSA